MAAAPSAPGPSGEAETTAQGSSALPVILSSNRRADISTYKGSTFVNIREYYEVAVLHSIMYISSGCAFTSVHTLPASFDGDLAPVLRRKMVRCCLVPKE